MVIYLFTDVPQPVPQLELWEFTIEDVNFVHAVAQIVGMSIDLCRLNKGYKTSIEVLKTMRDPKLLKTK